MRTQKNNNRVGWPFWLCVLTFSLLCCLGCQKTKENCQPELLSSQQDPAVNILSKHNIRDLILTWSRTTEKPEIPGGKAIICQIPQQNNIANDYPKYYLLRFDNSHCFWIMVSGGFAGSTEWRGPAVLSGTDQITPGDKCE